MRLDAEQIFPAGIFLIGIFRFGIFPTGIFPVGIFLASIFPVGIFPVGIFLEVTHRINPDPRLPEDLSVSEHRWLPVSWPSGP